VPFVTRSEQVEFVREVVERSRAELRQEGLAFGNSVPVGVMIEVAASIQLMENWAWDVDFFALGTNDLMASALGIDRDNPVGTGRHDFLHPGLLHLISDAVSAAHNAGRKVTVCGEMAADPEGVLALMTLEVDAVSVAVNRIKAIKQCLTHKPPLGLAPQLVSARTIDQVRQLLQPWRSETPQS
jgi:phosphoenolpyruvate-protein kinase (PTS system EI component)